MRRQTEVARYHLGPVASACVFLCCLVALPPSAQAQVLRGWIVDSATSTGLPHARVALEDSSGVVRFHARTDSLGRYGLAFHPGRYRIVVSLRGYQTFRANLFQFGDTVPPNYIALARRVHPLGPR